MGKYFTRTGLIVLISVVFVAGIGTAYAGVVLPTITLGGNVEVIGNLDMTNGKITNLGPPTNPSDAVNLGSITTYEIKTDGVTLNAGETATEQPSCLPGDIATGGGFFSSMTGGFEDDPRILLRSFGSPLSSIAPPTSWVVTMHNSGSTSLAFSGYVVCLDITPTPLA